MVETYHSNVIRCLIWDLQETSLGRSNGTSWIRTTETSWWHTAETSLGVSFQTCLRRHGDVLMGGRCYVLLRRHHDISIRRHRDVPLSHLGDVPTRRRWVFHLGHICHVARTYRETSLQRCNDVSLPGGEVYVYLMRSRKQILQKKALFYDEIKKKEKIDLWRWKSTVNFNN